MSEKKTRYDFLEGIRGVAAIQVALLHFFAIFYPVFARVATSAVPSIQAKASTTPLFMFINGYAAVHIFFIMSGLVLTQAFLKAEQTVIQMALKRFIRLFIPVFSITAITIALILLLQLPADHNLAATGSPWAQALFHFAPSLHSVMKETFFNSMLVGYGGISLFAGIPSIAQYLDPLTSSTNAPLWTLHIEFWGSILTIITVAAYKKLPKPAFWTFFLLELLVCNLTNYSLFLLGFVIYIFRDHFFKQSLSKEIVAVVLLLVGVAATSMIDLNSLVVNSEEYVFGFITFKLTKELFIYEIPAVLMFIGLISSRYTRKLFSSDLFTWLGKISLSVYLIHFPLFFLFSGIIYNWSMAVNGHMASTILTFVAYLFILFPLAVLFQKFIDTKAIQLSRYMTNPKSKNLGFTQEANS